MIRNLLRAVRVAAWVPLFYGTVMTVIGGLLFLAISFGGNRGWAEPWPALWWHLEIMIGAIIVGSIAKRLSRIRWSPEPVDESFNITMDKSVWGG